jgi:type IV pilus assembly protein PilE
MHIKFKGFTLVELMVVVAIVSILATIAYPSYQGYVQNARRADAQGALVQLNGAMERLFTVNNTYLVAGNLPALGTNGIFAAQTPLDGSTKYYNLAISANATTFTLSATPIAGTGQASNGRMELDHTGAKRWDKDNNAAFSAAENTWK